VRYEYDLRPYASSALEWHKAERSVLPGLECTVAYVGCDRDREVVAVNVASPTAGAFLAHSTGCNPKA